MQAYSNTIRDLYALAEYATPDQFLTQAVGLLKTWIRFDGVLFGTGEASQISNREPQSAQKDKQPVAQPAQSWDTVRSAPHTPVKRGDDLILNEDLVARGYREAPYAPARGGIREIYRKSAQQKNGHKTHASAGPLTLIQELRLCHVIVVGDNVSKVRPARWMVLYRRHDVRFSHTDAAHLHSLWQHLSRALVLNRTQHLQRKTLESNKDAAATGLINLQGEIEIADARFYALLEREWPEVAPQSVPEVALDCLRAGKVFLGQKIEITLHQQHGFNRCRIRPIKTWDVLSPREFVIARRFAAGMSHKQIARELGVSHHTIRNQLAHMYRKLNVHDKPSLSHYLHTNGLNN